MHVQPQQQFLTTCSPTWRPRTPRCTPQRAPQHSAPRSVLRHPATMTLVKSGWPRRAVGSPVCHPEGAIVHSVLGVNGTSEASSGMRRASGVSNCERVGPQTLSRPICARVHCARAGLGCAGLAPPARSPPLPPSGGRVPIGGAPSLGRSRSPHRRHGVKLATSTTPRVPEMVQVATGHSPLRGFPRIGEASRMPIIPVAPL